MLRPGEGWELLLGPGEVLDRHYRVLSVLALAGGGVTYRARAIDALDAEVGPELAIKVLYAQRVTGEHLLRLGNEAQMLRRLAHPNIVECLGFTHRDGSAPYIVTRFEHGGTLADHLHRVGPVRPTVAAAVTRQLVGALQQAHALGIVHRDMKPQNVLLRAACGRDEVPAIRVADFGIAKVGGGLGDGATRVGAFLGTPEYAAPEQFEGRPPSAATDLFAVGAIFYALLAGGPAFRPSDRNDVLRSLDELRSLLPPRLPEAIAEGAAGRAAQAVIDATLRERASDRADAPTLLDLLDEVILPRAAAAGPASGRAEPPIAPRDPAPPPAWSTPPAAAASRGLTVAAGPPPSAPTLVADAPLPPRPPPTRGPLTLDDLVAGFAPPRPPEDTLAGEWVEPSFHGAPPPSRRVEPPAPPVRREESPPPLAAPEPPFPRTFTDSGAAAVPVADAERASVETLLAMLGGLVDDSPAERRALAMRLTADPRALAQAVGGVRPGAPPGRSVGFCRLAVLEGRADWTSRLRSLLPDPSPAVRGAACDALAVVGTIQGLSALPALGNDPDASVRGACARGLAWLAVRHGRADLARPTLERLARDADGSVRDEAGRQLDRLERGGR